MTIPIRVQDETQPGCLEPIDVSRYNEAMDLNRGLYTRRIFHIFDRFLQRIRGVAWNHRPELQSYEEFIAQRRLGNLIRRNIHEKQYVRVVADGTIGEVIPFGPSPLSTNTGGSFMLASRHKLFHDEEQLQYLIQHKLIPLSFQKYIRVFKEVREMHVDNTTYAELLTPQVVEMIGDVYNTVLYLPAGPPPGSIFHAINPNLDFDAITEAYFSESGYGVAIIDDLLTKEALNALIKFCNEATIFFDVKPGYLGAYVYNGLGIDLFCQIEDELRFYFPKILADHMLKNLWAYKYDGDLGGIRIHADDAAVNFNFWITPDDANLDKNTGGLIVYTKAAPLHDDLLRWNSINANAIKAMQEFIKTSGAEALNVPYRQNRAVLFNSNLLHESAPFQFKKGYTNRRINLTMLFGNRQPHRRDQ